MDTAFYANLSKPVKKYLGHTSPQNHKNFFFIKILHKENEAYISAKLRYFAL